MDPRVMQFVMAAAAAPHITALNTTLTAAMAELGITRFAYSVVRGTDSTPAQVVTTTYPAHWIERYMDRGYLEVDPVVTGALGGDRPFLWSGMRAPPEAAQLFDEAEQVGIVSGLCIPLPMAGGGRALMALSSPLDEAELGMLMNENATCALEIAWVYHQTAGTLHGVGSTRPEPLTRRQGDILRWLAEGRSVEAIGTLLSVPASVVARHVGEAAARLGLPARPPGVVAAEALRRGYIRSL